MEPDVKHEQPAEEEQQQQQQGEVAEPAEVKQQEEVQPEPEAAVKEESVPQEVSDDELREKLLQMLEESDLSTVTEKMLRKQLEEQLGVKLADKKQLIRQEVMAFLAKQQQDQDGEQDGEEGAADDEEQEEEEEEQDEKPRKRRNNSHLGSVLSEQMQAFLGAESMPRTQVVKAIWDYIKANNLQDPKDKRSIIPDAKLSTILTPPVTMFSMNKQISRHVFNRDSIMAAGSDDDEDGEQQPAKKPRKGSGDGGGGSGSSSRPKPKPRAKSAGSSQGGDGEKVLKGFAKPQRISEELAAVTGQAEMSRGTLMKWLFAYIKENNLYDPSNKRYVIADDALQKLTGEKRFIAFGAQKLFGKHFPK